MYSDLLLTDMSVSGSVDPISTVSKTGVIFPSVRVIMSRRGSDWQSTSSSAVHNDPGQDKDYQDNVARRGLACHKPGTHA